MSVRLPLFAVACGVALFALPGCGSQPVATGSGQAPATTTAAGTTPTTPASRPPGSAKPVAKTASTKLATGGCPVSAAQLQQATTMPDDWRIEAASIECSYGWAQAALTAPTPEQQGDGVVLFRFDPAAGHWVEVEQGSSIRCVAERGMPRKAAQGLSVCNRPF